MREPVARPIKAGTGKSDEVTAPMMREPRAFSAPETSQPIDSFVDETALVEIEPAQKRKPNWLARVALTSGGVLVSLGIGLAAEQLIRNLFARYEWLGWLGIGTLVVFVFFMLLLAIREALAIRSLRKLDRVRALAAETLVSDDAKSAQKILNALRDLYARRADMARPRKNLDETAHDLFDGSAMLVAAEAALMKPLDDRAKALTAAASRRVAVVTAISPRALVDIAFVAYESMKLARAIAQLYGARPGLFGTWRLLGAILGHLAVTGGIALGDSVVQQLVGHGLAAKVSARLGEGLVNGLMTVRVGIAAMRVTRPLPFNKLKQPVVMDYMADLARIGKANNPKE